MIGKNKLQIAVIDGMGGGLGSQIVARLRERLIDSLEIIALGSNSMATSRMLQNGAHRGATGENAVRVTVPQVDLITGPLGIMMPNAMMGEITPMMAEAIGLARGKKYLLPVNQSHFHLVGMQNRPMSELVDELVQRIEEEVRRYYEENAL